MQIKFITTSSDYRETADVVLATVERLEDNVERFEISLDFFSRRYAISATDFAGDASTVYMSRILAAFVEAFDERYATLDPSSSPADVFDELLEFAVEH